MTTKITFEEFMVEIDQELYNLTENTLTSDLLPDHPYRDAYETGISPKEVAKKILSKK